MTKITSIFSYLLIAVLLFVSISVSTIKADTDNNRVVYFYDPWCEGCRDLIGNGDYDKDGLLGEYDTSSSSYDESKDYMKKIEAAGIEIIYVNVLEPMTIDRIPYNVTYKLDDDGNLPTAGDIQIGFNIEYKTDSDKRGTPQMFVGDKAYYNEEIMDAIDSGEFFEKAKLDLLEVEAGDLFGDLKGVLGFLGVLGAGLLDGFNPCAIALLLMFISLVGFTDNKRVLIAVSITYITTMFLTYFLIGIGVLSVLEEFSKTSGLVDIVSWVIFILVLIFFIFNMYDFFVSRKQEYGKIKNQLPKWIQKMNKRIMKVFANAMNEEGEKGNLLGVITLTFFLGVTLSLTEFLCTGQIYLGILEGVRFFKDFYAYVALFFYNVMFVLPMIIIALIAIKNESIMGVSNWIREHLHLIKLFNALLFLAIAIFYAFRLFG